MKLVEHFLAVGARERLARRTKEVYWAWVEQFLRFHRQGDGWRRPEELRGADVAAFLTHLAGERQLSASSQNQAMNAVLFLYRRVLVETLGDDHLGVIHATRARRPVRVPTVLSGAEVARVLDAMKPHSMHHLMTRLLYGTGMRLMEVCTLRVRDIDFGRAQIIIREGKGDKDRLVVMPQALGATLGQWVADAQTRHANDVASGSGFVPAANQLHSGLDELSRNAPQFGRDRHPVEVGI